MRNGASACLALMTAALALVGGVLPAAATATPVPDARPGTAGTGPAPVRDVAAFDTGHAVRVTWTNPTTAFAGVTVRYAEGSHAPADPTAGTGATLRSPKSTSVPLIGLSPGTRYSVSVWTHNAARQYSRARTVRFNTLPAPEADATVSGTATDTSGNPLANVGVFIETFGGLNSDGARTDAAGHYALTVAAPGGYYVGFDGALAHGGVSDLTGYQSDVESVDELGPGESRTGVDAVLSPGAAITGRVSDPALHALAGVVPSVEPVTPYVEVTTDSSFGFFSFFGATDTNASAVNGTFAIKGLPPTTGRVCLDPTMGSVTGGTSDRVGYVGRCASRSVTVRVGRTADVGNLSLESNPGGVVTGLVTDSAGSPVAGAFVSAVRGPNGLVSDDAIAYTDAAGRYRISLRRGNYRICAEPDAGGPTTVSGLPGCSAQVRVTAGDVLTADIRLKPAGAIAGRILGPDGHPLTDADVEIRRAGHRFFFFGSASTDEHGQFEVNGLPAGDYYACVQPYPFPEPAYPTGVAAGCIGRQSPMHVQIGAVSLGLDGRLQVGGAVSGHVTDDSGAPTSEALVDVWGSRGSVDIEVSVAADGSYTVVGLPTGLYRVCATWLPPIESDGVVFGFGFLEECHSPQVEIVAGQTTAGVDRSVATGGSVTVAVHDAAGQPIGGVDVAAISRCPRNGFCSSIPLFDPDRAVSVADSQVTSADGIARLHGLRPGQYAICLFAYYGSTPEGSPRTGYGDSCAGHTMNVEVTNHQTTTVERQLDDAGAVSGTVTDVDGHPLAGVRIIVSNAATSDYTDPSEFDVYLPDGPAADAVTDARGHFSVRGVTPGEQTVCVDATGATGGSSHTGYLDSCVGGSNPNAATPVQVQVDSSTDVHLSLTPGAAISGRLTTASGHGRFFEVVAFGRRSGSAVGLNHPGTYRLSRLPAGTYVVCFLADRYQSQCFDKVTWNDRKLPPRSAAKIVLRAGEERRHVNAVLHK